MNLLRHGPVVVALCLAAGMAIGPLPASAAKTTPDETATLVGKGVGLNFQDTATCPTGTEYTGFRTSHEVWQKNGKLVAHAAGTQEFYFEDGSGGFENICGQTFGWEIFSDSGVAFKTGEATDSAWGCVGFVDPNQPFGSRVQCEEGGGGLQHLKIIKP